MISLITCVYNGEKYIDSFFNAVMNQTFSDFEIVMVNDGSKDNTLSLIEAYKNKINNLKIIDKQNSGLGDSRNMAVDNCEGDYVCFADIDDEILPDYMETLNNLISNPKIDFGIAQIKRVFVDKPNPLTKNFKYIQDVEQIDIANVKDNQHLLTEIGNAAYSKIIRKSVLLDNNIKFATDKYYEDLLFTQTLLYCNPTISISNKTVYNYFVHSESIMTSKTYKVKDMYDVFDELVKFAINKNVFETYHEELVYLAYYHIAIGTMYRLYRIEPLHFFENRKFAKQWLIAHNLACTNNKYFKNMPIFVKLYLKIFFGAK